MAADITVGLDSFDRVVRVQFDDVGTGRRAHVDWDEDTAEKAAAAFASGVGAVQFRDTVTGSPVLFPIAGRNIEVAGWLRSAAAALRARKLGQVDPRTAMGRVSKA